MRTSKSLLMVFVIGCMLSAAGTAHAVIVPVLKVDFEPSAGGVTESGFQSMSATPTTFSTGLGSVTVTLSGGDGFYPRNSMGGAVPYKDLYNDFYYQNGSGGFFTVKLGGLPSSDLFQLRLYSFDYNNDSPSTANVHTVTFTPTSGTLGTTGQVIYTAGVAPTTNEQYSTLVSWISSVSGEITFNVSDDPSSPRINGFELSEVVPEPSTVVLLAGAVFPLAMRRRSRAA